MNLRSVARTVVLSACRRLGANRAARHRMRRQLLVLTYHGVVARRHTDRLRYANTVSVAEFEQHLRVLRRHFTPIGQADLLAWYEGRQSLPDNAVLVTFDDGYRNNLTLAVPVLKSHDIPCIFHVATGYIGTPRMLWTVEVVSRLLRWPDAFVPTPDGADAPVPGGDLERRQLASRLKEQCKRISWDVLQGYLQRLREPGIELEENEELYRFMTWDEVRELRRQGFEIGSHTVEHPILSQVSPAQLQFELMESKRRIEQETGEPCVAIAYPNGDPGSISNMVVKEARDASYRLGFTVIEQFTAKPVNALAVNRLCIMGHLPVNSFHCRVSGVSTPSDGGIPHFAAPELARPATR
ncbi:MAG: polysaccharide deacetylase family protein [Bryobacteraceae bacterium]